MIYRPDPRQPLDLRGPFLATLCVGPFLIGLLVLSLAVMP